MKVKSAFELFQKEFLLSDTLYCCYCLEPKEEKFGCCQENHFIEFKYLNYIEQKHIINEELELAFGEK
jgi:hypothetical protein